MRVRLSTRQPSDRGGRGDHRSRRWDRCAMIPARRSIAGSPAALNTAPRCRPACCTRTRQADRDHDSPVWHRRSYTYDDLLHEVSTLAGRSTRLRLGDRVITTCPGYPKRCSPCSRARASAPSLRRVRRRVERTRHPHRRCEAARILTAPRDRGRARRPALPLLRCRDRPGRARAGHLRSWCSARRRRRRSGRAR